MNAGKCAGANSEVPSTYSMTTHGDEKLSPDRSTWMGAGIANPLACSTCRSRNSSAAASGLFFRLAAPCRRTTTRRVVPSDRSISSAVTCAETPPFRSQTLSKRLDGSIFRTSRSNASRVPGWVIGFTGRSCAVVPRQPQRAKAANGLSRISCPIVRSSVPNAASFGRNVSLR